MKKKMRISVSSFPKKIFLQLISTRKSRGKSSSKGLYNKNKKSIISSSLLSSSQQQQQQENTRREDTMTGDDGCENKIVMHEDILQEILLKLSLRTLQRCMLLSNSSRYLIYSSPFLDNYLKSRRIDVSPFMLGFFYQKGYSRKSVGFVSYSSEGVNPTKIGTPPFDQSLSFLLSTTASTKITSDELKTKVCLIGSCNGFLLCKKEQYRYKDIVEDYHYCVCNPITKQCVTLPKPPKANKMHCVIEAFTCPGSNYPCLDWAAYKVVLGLRAQPYNVIACYLDLEIFSSKTGQWIEVQLSYASPFLVYKDCAVSEKGTVCSDASYPDSGSYVYVYIAFNINLSTPQMQLLTTPPKLQTDNDMCISAYLGQSQGYIQYVEYQYSAKGNFEIWELNDDSVCELNWCLKYRVRTEEIFPRHITYGGTLYGVMLETLHPLNSAAVLVCFNGKIMLADLKNKSLEPICMHPSNSYSWHPYQWPCWPPLSV